MFICYNNETIIGKVKTEEEARKICKELGTSYRKVRPILFFLDLAQDYTMNTKFGFLTYKEVVKKGKEVMKEKGIAKKDSSLEEVLPIFEEMFGEGCMSKVVEKKLSELN